MERKPRIYRGAEHNLTVSTGEYPETKVVTRALLMLTGAFMMLAKFVINRKQHPRTEISSDLSKHPVITTFPSVTGKRARR